MRLVACALVVACCAGACSSGSSSTTAAPTNTTAPGAPAPDPTCTEFHGTEGPLQSYGDRPEGLLVDAYVEEVGCLDRVTFEFKSLGDGTPPGYTVTSRDLDRDPLINSVGGAIELPAKAGIIVELKPARSTDARLPDNPPTYRGNLRLSYGATHHIDIVQELDDTADGLVWVIGLDAARPFVVDSAMSPTRVSIYIG
ncbi:MAG: hypothetical protein ACHQIG_05360 [Acidimicrobiia bacterium]